MKKKEVFRRRGRNINDLLEKENQITLEELSFLKLLS